MDLVEIIILKPHLLIPGPISISPLFSSQIQPQISLCKKKTITSKYRHMHVVLNIDEI
jgi:hypothetical protein